MNTPNNVESIVTEITDRKASEIASRGYKLTGYVLTNEAGQKCIVDCQAVRWITGDSFSRFMHPETENPAVGLVPLHLVKHKNGFWQQSSQGRVRHLQSLGEPARSDWSFMTVYRKPDSQIAR